MLNICHMANVVFIFQHGLWWIRKADTEATACYSLDTTVLPTYGTSRTLSSSSFVVVMSLPRNFSWLVAGKLAGCGCPASEAELRAMIAAGVRHLITLSASDFPPPACAAAMFDLSWIPLAVPEFRGPSLENFHLFFQVCESAKGEGVAVHCRMGRGRTGCLLAAYLIRYDGLSAWEAIGRVRQARPGSVETRHQEEALEMLEKSLLQHSS